MQVYLYAFFYGEVPVFHDILNRAHDKKEECNIVNQGLPWWSSD